MRAYCSWCLEELGGLIPEYKDDAGLSHCSDFCRGCANLHRSMEILDNKYEREEIGEMFTEKIAVELSNIARHDSSTKVKLYAAINQGPALYKRLNKIMPLPAPLMKGDYQYLRMMYTACRWWIDVHGDK